MPRLWNTTIEAHRRDVREAVLDAAASLVRDRGVRSVTMADIAASTGIGRATLYKYFANVEDILGAWHEREIARHLAQLQAIVDTGGTAVVRLRAVLDAWARIAHQQRSHDSAAAAALHRGDHVAAARQDLVELVSALVGQAVAAGEVRDDVAPRELALYCIHALGAASGVRSKAAIERLVELTFRSLLAPS